MSKFELYIDENAANNESCNGLDVNDTEAATDWVKIESCEEVMIYIEPKSGASTVFETCVEVSPDGIFNGGCFVDEGELVKLQGSGFMHIYDTKAIEYLRVRCLTAQGAGATANIYIQGFRKT